MKMRHQSIQKASRPLAAAAVAAAAVTAGEDVQFSIGQALQDDFSRAPDDEMPSACPSVLRNMSLHVADLLYVTYLL